MDLESERNIAATILIGDPLERPVLDDETPSREKRASESRDRKGHHDDERLKISWSLAVVEEVWGNDVSDVTTHVDLYVVSQIVQVPARNRELTSAPAAARFSGVVFSVETAQVYTRGFAEKEPGVNKNAAKYRAALFKVATVMTNPMIETHRAGMMWNERSLILSEFHAHKQETIAAKM